MSWTAAHTWVANELVTATLMNTHVRDNLNALKDPPFARYEFNEGADYAITNSATWADVDSTDLALQITLTVAADVQIVFVGNVKQAAENDKFYVDVDMDGARLGGDDGLLGINAPHIGGAPGLPISLVHFEPDVAAGTHTFKLQTKTDGASATTVLYAGAGTSNGDMHGQFWVRETS